MAATRLDRIGRTVDILMPLKRAVSLLTLAAFLLNSIVIDISWAVGTPSALPGGGDEASYGTGGIDKKEVNPDTFSLPEYLGSVKYSYKAPGSVRTVIHIQDAHCNYAAQHKVKDILEHLDKEYGVDIINLEGGAKEYDLSIFARLGNGIAREKTVDYFVKEGLVSGAEYFAINDPDRATLWGIEDAKLYIENLNIYRKSLQYKEEVDRHLKAIGHTLNNLKAKIYSLELLDLDRRYSQYKSGKIEFKDYLSYLIDTAKSRSIDIRSYTNIFLLKTALEEESKIDFKKANNQRDELIDILQKKLSKKSVDELIVKTVECKTEKISSRDFYQYLSKKSGLVGVEIKSFPDLQRYIIYISMYGAIDKSRIIDEMDALESRLKESMYRADDERELGRLSKNLAIAENIFNISLTKEDYKYYVDNKAGFAVSGYMKFIEALAPKHNITARPDKNIADLDRHREDMSKFYEYSFRRDEAFRGNMKFGRNNSAVVVTGGFHTESLCDIFRKEGISYVSIMPSFRNDDGYDCPYFRLLAGNECAFLKELRPIFAPGSAIQIPSMLSEVIASEAWGKANIDSFRAAAIIRRYMDEGNKVEIILDDGRVMTFGEGEKKVTLTTRGLLDAVHQADIDGEMERLPESAEDALAAFGVQGRIKFGFGTKQILEQWVKEHLKYSTFDFGQDVAMAQLERYAEKDFENIATLLRQSFLIDRNIGTLISEINTKLDRMGFTDVNIAKVVLSADMNLGWVAARGDLHIDHDYNYSTSTRFMELVPTDFNLQRDTAYCLYVDIMRFVNGGTAAQIDEAELKGIMAHEAGHAVVGMVAPSLIADTDHTAHIRLLDAFMKLQPYIAIPEEVGEHIKSVQDLINLGEYVANWVAFKLYGQDAAKSLLLSVIRDAGQSQEGTNRTLLEEANRAADLVAFANKIGVDTSRIPSNLVSQAELRPSEVEFYEKLFDELRFKDPAEIADGVTGPLQLTRSDIFLSASADQGIYAIGAAEYAGESIGLGIERQAVENQSIPQHVKLLSATRAMGVVPEKSVDKIACVGIVISTDPRQGEEVVEDILTAVKDDGGLIHFKPRDKITDKDRWITFCSEVAKRMNLELEIVNKDTAVHGILFKVTPAKISITLHQAVKGMSEELRVRILADPAVTVKILSSLGWIEVPLSDVALVYGQKILLYNEHLNQYEVYVYDGLQWQFEQASISEWGLLYNYNTVANKVEHELAYVYVTLGGALKDIGIPGAGEAVGVDSRTLKRWNDLAAKVNIETKAVNGMPISAKFITSEASGRGVMPRGLSSYHFIDDDDNLVIVVDCNISAEELNEAFYHEWREAHWISVISDESRQASTPVTGELIKTIRSNAHILASAEESVAFGDTGLTPFHARQIAGMSQGLIERLLHEDRQAHHALIQARLSTKDYTKYLSYEERFISKLKKALPAAYFSVDVPKDADDSLIGIEQYIETSLPMIEELVEGKASIELHVGLRSDAEDYVDGLRRDGFNVGEIPNTDIWGSLYRSERDGRIVYILGGIAGRSRFTEFLGMLKYKGVPEENVKIIEHETDYKAVYDRAFAGTDTRFDQCVIFSNQKRLTEAMSRVDPDISIEPVEADGLTYSIATEKSGRRILTIDLRDAYGDQAEKVANYVIGTLGVKNVLFAGLCGGVGAGLDLNDIISYSGILDEDGFAVDMPENALDMKRLGEAFSEYLGAERRVSSAIGANAAALVLEKRSDLALWREKNAGFVEMELLHIAKVLRSHPDVKFEAILRVSDLPGGRRGVNGVIGADVPGEVSAERNKWRESVARYILSGQGAETQNIDEREAAAMDMLNDDFMDRGNSVVAVIGIPESEEKGRDISETINNINGFIKESGMGPIDDNKQIITYKIDGENTKANLEKAMKYARDGLPSKGKIVLFAPKMENGPNLADMVHDQYMYDKQYREVLIVISDAYTDYDFAKNVYPDIMARVAIARGVAFCLSHGDNAEALNNIKNFLARITDSEALSGAGDINELLKRLNEMTLKIRPVNYSSDIKNWRASQEAIATSL